MRAGRTPLVGREVELSRLLSALEEALAGAGGVVLLSGEPGMGKTRLAEELAEQAAAEGAVVCWGRCWEAGGAPPFWPWIEVLRALPGVPEEVLSAAADLDSPAGEQVRFHRFDAVARSLVDASQGQGLLVLLDDAHAADPSSLLLLELVGRSAQRARILLVAAYRAAEAAAGPAAEVVERLRRGSVHLDLAGLAEDDIARLVAERNGAPPAAGRLAALSAASGGNPFLVMELAGLQPGEPLPASVRQAVSRGLAGVPPPVLELLGIAAVGGREIDPSVLAAVSGRTELEVAVQLEAAERAASLTRAHGRLRFRHILVRDVLEGGLDPAERRRLHVAFAEALEARLGPTAAHQLAAAARHRRAGLPLGTRAEALRATLAAARHCDALLAHEAAAEEYERAIDLVDDETTAVDVLLAHGAACNRAGHSGAARAAFDQAAELSRRLGDSRRFALAVIGAADKQPFQRADPALISALEGALRGLDPADGRLRVRLLASLTRAQVYAGATDAAPATGAAAVALARSIGDWGLLADALHAEQVGMWRPDTVEARLAAAEEVVALAMASGDLERALGGQLWLLIAHLQRCDIGGVDRAVRSYTVLAEASRQPRHRFVALSRQAMCAFLTGAYGDGERLAAEARAVGLTAGEPDAEIIYHGLRALPHLAAGADVSELEKVFRAFSAEHTSVGSRCLLALFACARGAPAEAQARLDELAGDDDRFSAVPVDMDWLLCLCLLTEVAVRTGDTARCEALYTLLAPFAGHGAQVAGSVSFAGAVDHYLGMAAGALGRTPAAQRHLNAARRIHAGMGARPWLARTALEQVRLGLAAPAEAAALATGPATAGLARELARESPRESAVAPGGSAAVSAPIRRAVLLRRAGAVWEVGYPEAKFQLPDSRGLQHLARLLRVPGQEIHVLELAGRPAGDAGAVLDSAAKAAYRARIVELRDEVDDARNAADPFRAERAELELDALMAQLGAAVGLGGRERRAGSGAERARVAVRKALGSTLRRITERDPDLGLLLSTTVRTGTYCCYTPDPRWPVRWEL